MVRLVGAAQQLLHRLALLLLLGRERHAVADVAAARADFVVGPIAALLLLPRHLVRVQHELLRHGGDGASGGLAAGGRAGRRAGGRRARRAAHLGEAVALGLRDDADAVAVVEARLLQPKPKMPSLPSAWNGGSLEFSLVLSSSSCALNSRAADDGGALIGRLVRLGPPLELLLVEAAAEVEHGDVLQLAAVRRIARVHEVQLDRRRRPAAPRVGPRAPRAQQRLDRVVEELAEEVVRRLLPALGGELVLLLGDRLEVVAHDDLLRDAHRQAVARLRQHEAAAQGVEVHWVRQRLAVHVARLPLRPVLPQRALQLRREAQHLFELRRRLQVVVAEDDGDARGVAVDVHVDARAGGPAGVGRGLSGEGRHGRRSGAARSPVSAQRRFARRPGVTMSRRSVG